MKKLTAKVIVAILMVLTLTSLTACGKGQAKTYKVGICNFVDDASLNQICDNIQQKLKAVEGEKNVTIEVLYDNCNMDFNTLPQIVSTFMDKKVDVMVGIATPVPIQMQTSTAKNPIPVVFAAVSDPLGCDLVASMEAPGANITGTSDYLNTKAIFDIMFAVDPDLKKVGLLYDQGQDSSTAAIADAQA